MEDNLKVLLLKGKQKWVALCLDYNIVAQDDDRNQAMRKLCETIIAHMKQCRAEGLDPLHDFFPADEKYWSLHEKIAAQVAFASSQQFDFNHDTFSCHVGIKEGEKEMSMAA